MSNDKNESPETSSAEKQFTPFVSLTDNPTNPNAVPFSTTAPEGLALVYSAGNPSEADLTRQVLRDAGFHVEYVPSVTTGVFGTTGSAHVYVDACQEKEACEFLRQLRETAVEEQLQDDET